jgi:hypothetical protein
MSKNKLFGWKNSLHSLVLFGALAMASGCATKNNWKEDCQWPVQTVKSKEKVSSSSSLDLVEKKFSYTKDEKNNQFNFQIPISKKTEDKYSIKNIQTQDFGYWKYEADQNLDVGKLIVGFGIVYPFKCAFSFGVIPTADFFKTIPYFVFGKKDYDPCFMENIKFRTDYSTKRLINIIKTHTKNLGESFSHYEYETKAVSSKDVPCSVFSEDFLINSKSSNERILSKEKGIFQFTLSPLGDGFVSKNLAENKTLEELTKIYHLEKIKPFLQGNSFFEKSVGSIKLDTCERNSVNDSVNYNFDIFYPVHLQNIVGAQLRKSLENYLEKNIPMQTVYIRVLGTDGMPLENPRLEREGIEEIITSDYIDKKQADFLISYLKDSKYGSVLKIDSKKYISKIPKLIDAKDNPNIYDKKTGGFTFKVNPAKYALKLKHANYELKEEKFSLKEEDLEVIVYLDKRRIGYDHKISLGEENIPSEIKPLK